MKLSRLSTLGPAPALLAIAMMFASGAMAQTSSKPPPGPSSNGKSDWGVYVPGPPGKPPTPKESGAKGTITFSGKTIILTPPVPPGGTPQPKEIPFKCGEVALLGEPVPAKRNPDGSTTKETIKYTAWVVTCTSRGAIWTSIPSGPFLSSAGTGSGPPGGLARPTADLTDDGVVDGNDLTILVDSYGVDLRGDINRDGVTDAFDLSILLERFGTDGGDASAFDALGDVD